MIRRHPLLLAAALVVPAALAVGLVLSGGGVPTPTAAPSLAAASGVATTRPTASTPVGPSESRPAVPGAPPASQRADVPALVGAIGDSLTAAFDADRFGPQPEHSWAVGTDPTDAVDSHLERLRAVGGGRLVADASRSGARIDAAVAQARQVVRAVDGLRPGATAYVTFELGANDACRSDQAPTSLARFEAAARDAFAILGDGLPAGSLLVVLSVPDVPRLRDVFADVPAALDLYRRYRICPPALGDGADRSATSRRIVGYNAILHRLCTELAGARVRCRDDQDDPRHSLFGAQLDRADLSAIDHFHPSLVGQARIADEAWRLTPWSSRG
jgi:lysophospholipase L1-like esterase